ncbi:MAG TPA: hypothetical protein VL989_00250 [Candidatus Sulfotelmatobacter sp.]|nr:hypothetical protein [Candidatus Sulfotelmatobacter sp.]
MRLLILYRPESEHGRTVEEFVNDFRKTHDTSFLEVINIDSREGIATATLYDIVEYPAILVLQSDGSVQKIWQGAQLPLMDEIASYVSA